MTDDAIALMHLAHQLHRSLDRRLQGDFVHPKPPEAQIAALWQIRQSPGMTVRELADELQMQPNNASALVTAMVKSGLLTREPDPQDRRVVRLHVTEQARGRIDEVQGLSSGYLDAALGDLGDDERAAVHAAIPVLARIARHVRDGRPHREA